MRKAKIKAGGVSVGDSIKVNVFVTDMGQFAAINDVYKTFFTQDFPARAVIEVSALPLGADIEIEAVATLRPVIERHPNPCTNLIVRESMVK